MKPLLFITGMHRSGTSFLARALNLLGVYLGEHESMITDDWRTHKSNLRGHWENQNFLNLTEKTLRYNNGKWFNVPKKIKISSTMGKEIKKFTNELEKNSILASGVKDPRIILCFDSWYKYLPKNLIVIGIFRHPLKVAESLKIRSNFKYEKSLELWSIYNRKLLNILENNKGFLLDFDWSKKKLLGEIRTISEKLDLGTTIDLEEWYSKELIKSGKTYRQNYQLDKEIIEIYKKLKERSTKNNEIRLEYKQKKHEMRGIIEKLLVQNQKQGQYFRELGGNKFK